MDGPISSQYFTLSSSSSSSSNSNSNRGFNESKAEWWLAFSFVGRLVAYIVLLVVLVLIVALVLKILEECDYWNSNEESRQPLQPKEENENDIISTYGTCDDLECGDCSSTRAEELYDGKICVICYDAQRNCFFVPCGHCATCYECAQRIMDAESKTCPVCRRFIAKVRKI